MKVALWRDRAGRRIGSICIAKERSTSQLGGERTVRRLLSPGSPRQDSGCKRGDIAMTASAIYAKGNLLGAPMKSNELGRLLGTGCRADDTDR